MKISPSIASADLMRIGEEVRYVNQYFDEIHLDVADGVAVGEISFGLKMCQRIREIGELPISLHLEVCSPLQYLEQVKDLRADVVFLQIDCLENAKEVIYAYRQGQIPTGINLSNLDRGREDLEELLGMTESILVNTTYHNDPEQKLRMDMVEFAAELAKREGYKVWIDGGLTWDVLEELKDSGIHAAVMGRAVFGDRQEAVRRRKKNGTDIERELSSAGRCDMLYFNSIN